MVKNSLHSKDQALFAFTCPRCEPILDFGKTNPICLFRINILEFGSEARGGASENSGNHTGGKKVTLFEPF
jgi:hypothetical protein